MSNTITSWTSLGMDWDNPNPHQSKYYEAIRLALLERYTAFTESLFPVALRVPIYENAFGTLKSYTIIKALESALNNETFLKSFWDYRNIERVQGKTLEIPNLFYRDGLSNPSGYLRRKHSSGYIRLFLRMEKVGKDGNLERYYSAEEFINIGIGDKININAVTTNRAPAQNLKATITGYYNDEEYSSKGWELDVPDSEYEYHETYFFSTYPAPCTYLTVDSLSEQFPQPCDQDLSQRLKNLKEKIQLLNYFWYDFSAYRGGFIYNSSKSAVWRRWSSEYWYESNSWHHEDKDTGWIGGYFDGGKYYPYLSIYNVYYGQSFWNEYCLRQAEFYTRNFINKANIPLSKTTYSKTSKYTMIFSSKIRLPYHSFYKILSSYHVGNSISVDISGLVSTYDEFKNYVLQKINEQGFDLKTVYWAYGDLSKGNYDFDILCVGLPRLYLGDNSIPIITSKDQFFYDTNYVQDFGVLGKYNSGDIYVNEYGAEGAILTKENTFDNAFTAITSDPTYGYIDTPQSYAGYNEVKEWILGGIPANLRNYSYNHILNIDKEKFRCNFSFK